MKGKGGYMSSRKLGLYLILVGIVLLALKLTINTGLKLYPEYKTDYKVGSEFQAYTVNYFYGANGVSMDEATLDVYYTGFRIDLFSNIVGYILVIIGVGKLKDVSRVLSLTKMIAIVGLALSVIIEVLPFVLNGYKLCYVALFTGIAELFAAVSVGYLFVYAICTILDDVAFKSDRAYIGMSYIGMAILMIVVAFVGWVSAVSIILLGFYSLVCAFVTGLLLFNILKVKDYITRERGLE